MGDVDLINHLVSHDEDLARWQANPEYTKYLAELTASNADRLRHEPERIAQEQRRIVQETQELAFRSYKGFIQTADSSKEIFTEFLTVSKHVGDMLDKLPALADQSNAFLAAAPAIAHKRKINLHILQHHTQLLELLEIPQLMDTLVRGGHYEEALDLDAHMARMARKLSDVAVVQAIAAEVKRSTRSMLTQLLQLLRSDINLPSALRVVSHIRRLAVFTEPELRLKFLHARGSWLKGSLQAVDPADPYTLLNKSIDVFRLSVSDIISQYRAVFAADSGAAVLDAPDGGAAQLYGWATATVSQFLALVKAHLPRVSEGALLHSLMDQCVYLGQLLGRAGLDCRPLLIPVFEEAVVALYVKTVGPATEAFISEVSVNPRLVCTPAGTSAAARGLSAVSDYTYAAILVNAYIDALNNLRHCPPLSIAHRLVAYTEDQLLKVSEALAGKYADYVELHGDDDPHLRDRYLQLCEVWALDGIPFVARCFGTVYPPGVTAATPLPTVDIKRPAAPLEPIYRARLKARVEQPTQLLVPAARAPDVREASETTSAAPAAAGAMEAEPGAAARVAGPAAETMAPSPSPDARPGLHTDLPGSGGAQPADDADKSPQAEAAHNADSLRADVGLVRGAAGDAAHRVAEPEQEAEQESALAMSHERLSATHTSEAALETGYH